MRNSEKKKEKRDLIIHKRKKKSGKNSMVSLQ